MLISNRLTRLQERGDTIVEVLIAIALVSLVLGGAYVTTNHSLLATREAQERGVALKLVETQIEQLKGTVAADPDSIFNTAPSAFCITGTHTVNDAASMTGACALNEAGAHATQEPMYHLSTSLVKTGTLNTFTITGTWSSVRGDKTNKLQMQYRVYQ